MFLGTRCIVLVIALLAPASIQAQSALCVKKFLAQGKQEPTLGIAGAEAESLITQVAQSIGLRRPVTVVPCSFAEKAYTWPGEDGSGVPNGEYIIYNPNWIREILGKDRVQAVALFGHELAHFLNADFTTRKNIPRQEQERDADRFAGCAVARMSGDFSKLEDLLSRIRLEKDSVYPDRLTSIDSAREGFKSCGGSSAPVGVVNEGRFRVRQIDEVFEAVIAVQELCFDQLRKTSTVAGSCIRDYLNKAQIVATAFDLGGIYRPPGKDDATVWIGTSGYGIRHLPDQRSYKNPAFADSDLLDLLVQVPDVPLESGSGKELVDPSALLSNLRKLAAFSETDVLADWFKRHQAQGEYLRKYGSAYKVYEVQVDDYGEQLLRVKKWLDRLHAEWNKLKMLPQMKAFA